MTRTIFNLLLCLLLYLCAQHRLLHGVAFADTFSAIPLHGINQAVQERNVVKSELRVISLAPSITEILFAINAGESLVGISSFCDYPTEVKKLPRVGAYTDPNYEAILMLKPDLVIVLGNHGGRRVHLEKLGVKVLSVENESIAEILDSINSIGFALGKDFQAKHLRIDIERQIEFVKIKIANKPRPKVVISVGGHQGGDVFRSVYLAGKSTIYDELITLAGGKNAYQALSGYPMFSAEGLIKLAPEVVLDLLPNDENKSINKESVINIWGSLPELTAVKNKRVYVFTEEYMVNPGPRIPQILRSMVSAIHPDVVL